MLDETPYDNLSELCMRITTQIWSAALCAVAASAASAAIGDADAGKLTAKYNCQACHTVDKKLVGPAFKDVAKKYTGDATAADKLQAKVKNGSTGVWGPIPMPPNAVDPSDLKVLVEWILSLN
jgi:cytochrome c